MLRGNVAESCSLTISSDKVGKHKWVISQCSKIFTLQEHDPQYETDRVHLKSMSLTRHTKSRQTPT